MCPMCEKRGITEIHKKTSIAQWVFCLGMFTVGCAAGCCLVPFCVDGCKDTIHICSHCKVPLGRKTLLMWSTWRILKFIIIWLVNVNCLNNCHFIFNSLSSGDWHKCCPPSCWGNLRNASSGTGSNRS